MASLTAGGIKSMGELIGGDASCTEQIKSTWLHMAAVQQYKKLGKPERFQSDPPAAFCLRDMPLQYAGQVVNLKHLVDWVNLEDGAADHLDTVDVYDAMCGGNYMALPAPFKPNKDPGELAFTMQLYILPKEGNGHQFVLKYARFQDKVRTDIAKEIFVAGRALTIHWGSSADNNAPLKLFYYMMDRLGGVQIRHWAQPSVVATVGGGNYDKGKRKAGFRFIEEFGPRANNRNQFVEWTDEQINNESSPIFGWQAGEVKEPLRNYASGSVGAKTLGRWAVTLKRFHPFVFDHVVVPILKSHDVHGTMWIGKTRVGKSTASKTIGFAISAYQIDKHDRVDLRPSVVTTKKVDFFRLEPGTVFKPAIADDTVLTKWAPDEIKAFLDPAEEDALLWARWGGASFAQNQSRQICINPYNEEFEKTVRSIRRGREEVAFKDFLEIVDCNFVCEKQSGYQMADVEAYLARSNIVPLTDDWIYLRLASTTKDPVPRFPWPAPDKPDLFTPEATPILRRYKKDQTFAPTDYDMHMRWSVAAMKKFSRGDDIGRSSAVRGPTLFDQDAPPRCQFPELDGEPDVASGAARSARDPPANPDGSDVEEDVFGFGGGMDGDGGAPAAVAPPAPLPKPVPVKREKGTFRFLKSSAGRGVIDLSTPTPKKRRPALEVELSQMLEDDGVASGAAASSSAGPPRVERA
ncbi:unnamed protein product [Prorocentrum cordatum]|uniref:Uncharacterized protein n=1 Tax=Prorocentrum cordatum TaxID=2364126 RepID=A0ABN9QQS9_9DINO|nr:unnamed protein product [Polarella glacialis]